MSEVVLFRISTGFHDRVKGAARRNDLSMNSFITASLAVAVLQFQLEAAGVTKSHDGRRIQAEDECLGQRAHLRLQRTDHGANLLIRQLALLPWL